MPQKIDEILDLVLQEIEKGKSIEDCLKDYPQFVTELEPLLHLALAIRELPKHQPSSEAISRSLVKISETKERTTQLVPFQPAWVRIAAVILLVVLIGWSTLALSKSSVPGDVLYPIKIMSEKTQYALTLNPKRKALFHLRFADKRTEELALCLKRKNRIDKNLLNTMLNEARTALKFAEPIDRESDFLKAVQGVNQKQLAVLCEIMKCGCCREDVLAALKLCYEREYCIQYRANPKLKEEYNPYYEAWNRSCNW
ncbi:MAG: DUF5667 domain-containing protein [candidate division WOR-3 bacterium]